VTCGGNVGPSEAGTHCGQPLDIHSTVGEETGARSNGTR